MREPLPDPKTLGAQLRLTLAQGFLWLALKCAPEGRKTWFRIAVCFQGMADDAIADMSPRDRAELDRRMADK